MVTVAIVALLLAVTNLLSLHVVIVLLAATILLPATVAANHVLLTNTVPTAHRQTVQLTLASLPARRSHHAAARQHVQAHLLAQARHAPQQVVHAAGALALTAVAAKQSYT